MPDKPEKKDTIAYIEVMGKGGRMARIRMEVPNAKPWSEQPREEMRLDLYRLIDVVLDMIHGKEGG